MKKYILRFAIYLIGLFLTAFGTVITTFSNLGVACVTCLAKTIADLSNITLGTSLSLLYIIFVFIQLLILKKEFTILNFLQTLSGIVFGFFTDIILFFININPSNLAMELTTLILGLFIIAIGVSFTISTNLVPSSPDGLVQIISLKTHKKFGNIKTIFDLTLVILSLSLSLTFMKSLGSFNVATIISALFLGKFINVVNNLFKNRIEKLIY